MSSIFEFYTLILTLPYSDHNWKIVKILKPSYQELRIAWASMISEMLNAFTWSWWVTLTSKNPMPLRIIRDRFYWWLKCLRKALGHGFEVFWVIERQRRGAI